MKTKTVLLIASRPHVIWGSDPKDSGYYIMTSLLLFKTEDNLILTGVNIWVEQRSDHMAWYRAIMYTNGEMRSPTTVKY